MKKFKEPLYAYATKAYHKIGELSRGVKYDDPETKEEKKFNDFFKEIEENVQAFEDHVCQIYAEENDYWVGSWVSYPELKLRGFLKSLV